MPSSALRITLPDVIHHSYFSTSEAAKQVPWQIADYGFRELWQPPPVGVGTLGKFLEGPRKGKTAVVGIIDTGAPKDHPDLDGAILDARDFTGSPSGPWDVNGHGTHVAGDIAARYGNGKGVTGPAPESMLVCAKGLGDNGSGSDVGIANAFDWLLGRGDVDVINLSLGSDMHSPAIQQACERAAAAKVPVVAAAGNSGNQINWPGRLPCVICVGAVDKNRQIATFSCRGPEMDIAAPGVQILSTFLNGSYAMLSGTSMAAPWVAAVIALMIAADYTIDRGIDALLKRLRDASVDEGAPGHDYYFGWGLVTPSKAVMRGTPAAPGNGGGGVTPPAPGVPGENCFCVFRGLGQFLGA
jgi:subtilisin family serine protease